MNLHEYQAKELLKKFNVPVQDGIPVDTAEKAEEAYKQRGVAVGKSAEEIKTIAGNIIGRTLVTIQTGPAGKLVSKV